MRHNPYLGIDWANSMQIKSFSHGHTQKQEYYDRVYSYGYRHFPTSHYTPAKPVHPLGDYLNVADDIISSPNSEKAQSTGGGHINALGSFHEGYGSSNSGTFPEIHWNELYDDILAELQFPDAGGITINHPWLRLNHMIVRLDYDPRVLGIEVYNNGPRSQHPSYVELWDSILKTGRRCLGFFTFDWPLESFPSIDGSNMLLVQNFAEYDALKAYREGQFYGMIRDTGLRFTNLGASDEAIEVELNRDATIHFITEHGTEKTEVGSSASFNYDGKTYVRVEVEEEGEEYSTLFSNPFMLKNMDDLQQELDNNSEDKKRKKMMRNIILLN